MTKKLEDLLNLPDSKEIIEEGKKEKQEDAIVEQEDTMRSIQEFDKITVFSGWMFASSPAVSSLEHPVYDVTLLACAK